MEEKEKIFQRDIWKTIVVEGVTNVDDYLIIIALFYLNKYKDLKKVSFTCFKLVADELNKFFKEEETRKLYGEYSRDAFCKALDDEWLNDLDINQKKKLISTQKMIDCVGEDGTITLSSKLSDGYRRLQHTPSEIKFGSQEYEKRRKKVENNKPVFKNEFVKNDQDVKVDEELNAFWAKLFTDTRFEFPYLWENKLSKCEYDRLKELLIKCSKERKKDFIDYHGKKIALFVAEWFKREYKGRDDQGAQNAFSVIGLDNCAQNIWEECLYNFVDKLVYKSQGGTSLWLSSLYALGGFPIAYAVDNAAWERLGRKIWKSYEKSMMNEGIVQDLGTDNFDFFLNSAFRQSLSSSSGSLSKYLNSFLMEGHLPVAETDRSLPEFMRFSQSLEIGKIFDWEWRVTFSPAPKFPLMGREMVLTLKGDIYFQTNQHNWWSHLSQTYLENKGVRNLDNLSHFSLCIRFNGDNNQLSKLFTLSKDCVSNSYFCHGSSNKKIVRDFPQEKLLSVEVVFVAPASADGEKEIVVLQKIPMFDHIQLFRVKERPYLWSSKRNYNVETSLLLNDKCTLLTESVDEIERKFVDDETVYSWVDIVDKVSIKDKAGKQHDFYNRDNGISISFRACPNVKYKEKAKCLVEKTIEVVDDDEKMEMRDAIILFGGKGWYSVNWYNTKEDKRQSVNSEDVTDKAELKYKTDGDWQAWDEKVPQGVLRIKVSYKDKSVEKDVFYLPSFSETEIVHRNITKNGELERNKIYFNSRVKGIIPNSDVRNNENAFLWNKKENFICNIKCNDTRVRVEVFPPVSGRQVLFNGQVLHEMSSDNSLKIPFGLKDNFIVKDFSETGVQEHDLRHKKFNVVNILYEKKDVEGCKRPYHPENDIKFYLWDNMIYDKKRPFLVECKSLQKEFKFYFCSLPEFDIKDAKIAFNDDGKLVIPEELQSRKGFIFQSLKNCNPYYYAELRKFGEWYWNEDENIMDAFQYFKIAVEHHITFRLFDPIYECVKNDSALVNLFFKCCEEYGVENKMIFHALERFSKEFYFDWRLLNPIKILKEVDKDEKKRDFVEKFFRYLSLDEEEDLFKKDMYWDTNKDWRKPEWKMTGGSRSKEGGCQRCNERYNKWLSNNYKIDSIISEISKKLKKQ